MIAEHVVDRVIRLVYWRSISSLLLCGISAATIYPGTSFAVDVCGGVRPELYAQCQASEVQARTGIDANGVKRSPGPGCVPYSEYAVNCQTLKEWKASRGTSDEQQAAEGAAAEKSERNRQAALAASPKARGCITTSSGSHKEYTGQMTGFGAAYDTVNDDYITNSCTYPVDVEILKAGVLGGVSHTVIAPGETYTGSDLSVGDVRRQPK
jgi:hypothetical protein